MKDLPVGGLHAANDFAFIYHGPAPPLSDQVQSNSSHRPLVISFS